MKYRDDSCGNQIFLIGIKIVTLSALEFKNVGTCSDVGSETIKNKLIFFGKI